MKKILGIFMFCFPVISLAFSLGVQNDTNLGGVIGYVTEIVDLAIPLLVTVAFLVFFWGLSKFILNSNKQAEIENGKTYMMWGVLALFILLSFRAIIGLVTGDLFGNSSTDPNSILLPTDGLTPNVEVGPGSSGFNR